MKVIYSHNNAYVLAFEFGEEVMSGLKKFAQGKNIYAGSFSAIGATQKAVVAFYHLAEKKYEDILIAVESEIVGVLGNIATKDGEVAVHAHGSFSDEKGKVTAGHIKEMVVSASCEVMLQVYGGEMHRAYDEKTGLNLLQEQRE